MVYAYVHIPYPPLHIHIRPYSWLSPPPNVSVRSGLGATVRVRVIQEDTKIARFNHGQAVCLPCVPYGPSDIVMAMASDSIMIRQYVPGYAHIRHSVRP